MKYRILGRTGLRVSEIGFGGWGIGQTSWIGADDQVSIKALTAARDAGINFFDTALAYGNGHSERLLAKVFGKAENLVIASKVPPKNMVWPSRPNTSLHDTFPREHVLDCLKKTLTNLGREMVDIYQFHVWSDDWADDVEWCETIEEIRKSGQVRFIGISINDHEPTNVIRALETGLVDSVQVIYNIFDQSPEDKLFPYCHRHDIGVIARVPFDEGGLTGKIHPGVSFPERDFRNYYFVGDRKKQVWEKVQQLAAKTGVQHDELPDLALRFCLSHRAVSSVIPGMRTPAHVERNSAAPDKGVLPPEMIDNLHKHRWLRNFYSPPNTWTEKVKGQIQRLTKA